jgi:D-glycero-D-manno-heptose 1,7-bisphosphate phosphatase
MGYRVIVVTNQPVVARGWLTEAQLRSIHRVLEMRLQRRGARLDAIFYCPHHPEAISPISGPMPVAGNRGRR